MSGAARATGLLALALALAVAAGAPPPAGAAPAPPRAPVKTRPAARSRGGQEAALRDYAAIYRVFLSPRCRNCHPAGQAPLQGDGAGRPHAQNVSRASLAAGLKCTACHRGGNHARAGGPPGAPGWHMPSAEVPMVFEGKSPAALCAQLKDPQQTGGRAVAALVKHVEEDPFVRWAWQPGPGRAVPPIAHAALVEHVRRWVAAGAPCPR